MMHEPEVRRTLKMAGPVGWHGACSCGWEGASAILSESGAMKQAQQHCDDKNAALVEQAEITTDKTPTEVIEAVHALNTDHYDLLTTAWERGTTALSVFGGEGGYAAIRYTLSADLTEVLNVERVSYTKKKR